MNHPVHEIMSISPYYASKLQAQGIDTLQQLTAAASTEASRALLMAATGIPESLIRKWLHHAALLHIHGLDDQIAELLETAGIYTVTQLNTQDPAHLYARIQLINDLRHVSHHVPSLPELTHMIDESRQLGAFPE
jgi:predicted flap endonuclease-1-like 5' DNA nuclease